MKTNLSRLRAVRYERFRLPSFSVKLVIEACLLIAPMMPVMADPSPAAVQQQPDTMVPDSSFATSSITISPEEASVFQDALRAIATRAHVTIVAEDAPLHPRIFGKAGTIPPNASAAEVLRKVADTYDYDVSRVGPVLVLKKRYTDPRDLPAVTLDECVQSLNDISQALDAVNPDPRVDYARFRAQKMRELAASFSPYQLQAMQAKTADAGLPLASLSGDQQAAFRQFIVNLYLGVPDDAVHSALAYLRQAPQITLRVQKSRRDLSKTVSTTSGTETQTWTQETVFGFDAVDILPQPNFHPFGDLPPVPDDPTSPLTETRPEPGVGVEGYTTLEKLIASLATSSKKFAVDSPLRSKPVSVYGAGQVKPEEMLTALAGMYGLRVGEDDKGRKALYRPLFFPPLTLSELPKAVRHALPESLLRTLPDGEWQRALQEEQTVVQSLRPEVRRTAADWALARKATAKVQEAQTEMFARPGCLHQEAARRLQVAVKTQLLRQGTSEQVALAHGLFTSPVRLSVLPESARNAFGITFLTGALDDLLHTLGQHEPQWIANVDQSYLMGGPVPNPDPPFGPRFKLWIGYAGSDGRLNQIGGVDSLL